MVEEEEPQRQRNTDTTANYLLHAVVEERQAGVFVTDKGALLDETDEDLCLGEL